MTKINFNLSFDSDTIQPKIQLNYNLAETLAKDICIGYPMLDNEEIEKIIMYSLAKNLSIELGIKDQQDC